MDATYLAARIAALKTRIDETEQALTSIIAGEIETYKLDTGQSTQTITRHNVATLRKVWENDLSMLAILEARQGGSRTYNIAPGF